MPGNSIEDNGNIREDVPEAMILTIIRELHNRGFKVFLEPNLAKGGDFSNITDPSLIPKIYDLSLKWAKIAE